MIEWGAAGFEVVVGEGEVLAGGGSGAVGETRDGGGGEIEVREEVGEDEAEEEVLVAGGEVGDAGGAHDVGAEEAEGGVGEGVVKGDES